MQINYILTIYSSKPDMYGNSYHAFTFLDIAADKCVEGDTASADNADGMRRHWNVENDWDRTIDVRREELPIRQFNRYIKGWEYAGCLPKDIADFIRKKLAE
jgi:hypothetical protein